MTGRRRFLLTGACSLLEVACTPLSSPKPSVLAASATRVLPGVDVLAARQYDLLRRRRVGLITNHTAYNIQGLRSRVAMQRALGSSLVALYGPEHGIDGSVGAGKHIATRRDPMTGLTVHSLYGPTRKPTAGQLKDIDVLVFDVQDIGVRSYTYLSTMLVAMEACGEQGKTFVVLDRPNPLGGLRVEGPSVDPRWKSFVSQAPMAYVHGMTAGEIAMMALAEHWIAAKPALQVVRMQGWQRQMTWEHCGLRWHATSPNIPGSRSPLYYVATGILGGANAVDIGIGTARPFEYAGALSVNPQSMLNACQPLQTRGLTFSAYKRDAFGGVQLHIDPHTHADLTVLDARLLERLQSLSKGRVLARMTGDKLSLFNKVAGSDLLYRTLRAGQSIEPLMKSWSSEARDFANRRTRHLLYS
jgi:uncharacterized protein YbbC (DUF1343 family)